MANGSGSIPKRSEERTRRNKTGEDGLAVTKGRALGYQWIPPAPDRWDGRVKEWYAGLQNSGMKAYYEISDWYHAQIVGEAYDRWLKNSRPAVGALTEILNGMASIGTTEGERRRMKIELEADRSNEEDPQDDAKKRAHERMTSSPGADVIALHGAA